MWKLLVLLCASSSIGYASTQTPSSPLQIKDWFAFGSGCQGRQNGEGDVRMQTIADPQHPGQHSFTFAISSYKLDGSQPISAKRPTFARECSLRLAAHPGENWRITDLEVESDWVVKKDSGVMAEIHTRLMTGSGALAQWDRVWDDKEKLEGHYVHVAVKPSAQGREHLARTGCGEAKVLGADITFLNRRETFTPKVSITPDQSNKVVLKVVVERCDAKT